MYSCPRPLRSAALLLCVGIIGTVLISAWWQNDRSFATRAQAQGETQANRGADAIRAEATPHNAAEAKIETMLLLATRPPDAAMAAAAPKLHINPAHDAQGRIQLDITARLSPQLVKAVEDLDGAVVFVPTDPAAHNMRAWLPLRAVATLAARSDVYFVRTALPARHNQTPASPADAEGDIAHAADVARSRFPGATGGGVKIGVLSDSIDDSIGSLNAAPAGAVPATLNILNRQAGSGKGEGLAMVEIIHRMAPDATIYFATSNGGPDAMASNILRLEASGCQIIVDDITYAQESPFQDSVVSRAVSLVAANGVLYFSSVGDAGNKEFGTSSTFEGNFLPASTSASYAPPSYVPLPANATLAGFNSAHGVVDRIVVKATPTNPQSVITLYWNDPLPSSPTDFPRNQYYLYAFDQNNQLIGEAATPRGPFVEPAQAIDLSNNSSHPYLVTGDYIMVAKDNAAAPLVLHLETPEVAFADQSIATNGAARGHNASTGAISVGAVRAPGSSSFAKASNLAVESYSADGPRRMFFKPDGTKYTPDLSANGGIVLQKPDIVAADQVTTTIPGELKIFAGSSAAAPHAAAIAALIWSAKPSLTATQVRRALIASALDIKDRSGDAVAGYGVPMADKALSIINTWDWTFGADTDSTVSALSAQPDGKVFVGGSFGVINGQRSTYLARLNPDGSVDPDFKPHVSDGGGRVTGLMQRPQGKLIISGVFSTVDGQHRQRLAILNPDGSLDPVFTPDIGVPTDRGGVFAGAVQPADGKVLIGGSNGEMYGPARLARLKPDGSADPTFKPPSLKGYVSALALQPDGRVVVGGSFGRPGGRDPGNFIIRLKDNGSVDPDFVGAADNQVRGIWVRPNGKLLIVGDFGQVDGKARDQIARLNSDGSLDSGFNVKINPPGIFNKRLYSLAVLPDGKVLILGDFDTINGQPRDRIALLTADGDLDPAFTASGANGQMVAFAPQADGKVVISVNSQFNGQLISRLMRLNPL